MKLIIYLYKNNIRLELEKNGVVIDCKDLPYYHDLPDVLITSLDKLLKENSIDMKAITLCKIRERGDAGITARRLVQIFADALKIGQ
ncbi:MAG: hypothetical protein CEN90_408 [Parcubacteria group bacterium Licking1014_17]|nr:MAG: hypothetical protein CEN90_408 [Parcubacteria group bacterium Licking1014_17]